MASMPINRMFGPEDDHDRATEISVTSHQAGTAIVVQREGGELVFGAEIPVDCSRQNPPTCFAAGMKDTWERMSIRVDPHTRRKLKRKLDGIKDKRDRGFSEKDLAEDVKESEEFKAQVAKIPIGVQHAIMTVAPHGQFWLHVAKSRKGSQKGQEHLEKWLKENRDNLHFNHSSDIRRYLETLYPDTESRFGPECKASPFESDSTTLEIGFPTFIWPSEFSAIDGKPTKPKNKDDRHGHICIGLLSEPFEKCVAEIAGSAAVESTLSQIYAGETQGMHRPKQKENATDYLEPEMFDQNLLQEYVWIASAKALAGPPSKEFYKARKQKLREWISVEEYASHILKKLVFTTDRMIMRKSDDADAWDESSNLPEDLIANSAAAWRFVRKMVAGGDCPSSLGPNIHEIISQLSTELAQFVRTASSVKELSSSRFAIRNLLRLTIRHERFDLASTIVGDLDQLILENPDDGELERIRLYYAWRTHVSK